MPFIRRRGVAAAAAVIAAVMMTATACDSNTSHGEATSSASPQVQDDPGVDTGQNAGDTIGGFKLPDGIPAELTGKALQKWKDGGWKDFSHWKSKAEDFANPYIKDFWTPDRVAESTPINTKAASVSDIETQSSSTAQVWAPDGSSRRKAATRAKTAYTRYEPAMGKLFMTGPDGGHSCSAAVVTDPAHPGKSNLVWTAAHCIHQGKSGGWLRNIAFVPSYNNTGRYNLQQASQKFRTTAVTPRGVWWANWATASGHWIKEGNANAGSVGAAYDYAVLHVTPESGSKSLQQTVGSALPVWFNAPAAKNVRNMMDFGYPGESPYDGSKLYECRDARAKRLVVGYTYPSSYPAMYMMGCTMNHGSSGGPFVLAHKGRNYLVSDNALSDMKTYMAGPRLGSDAKRVYLATSNKFK